MCVKRAPGPEVAEAGHWWPATLLEGDDAELKADNLLLWLTSDWGLPRASTSDNYTLKYHKCGIQSACRRVDCGDFAGFSVSAQCSPADCLPGLASSRLAEAPTEDLRACLVSVMGSMTCCWASAAPASKCAAMSVSEPETESDTYLESLARSGVQHEPPPSHPLFLLSMGGGFARPELAAPAPFPASVSVWALMHICLVLGENWTVSCVPVQRGLCSVSGPVLPLGPISGNTPWGMPPPTGLAEKSKRGFF